MTNLLYYRLDNTHVQPLYKVKKVVDFNTYNIPVYCPPNCPASIYTIALQFHTSSFRWWIDLTAGNTQFNSCVITESAILLIKNKNKINAN